MKKKSFVCSSIAIAVYEVALYYRILKIDDIYQLILMMFSENNKIWEIASLYSISLYKILIEYECVQIFERLLENELYSNGANPKIISSIISK